MVLTECEFVWDAVLALLELPRVLLSDIYPNLHQAMHLSILIHEPVARLNDHGSDLASK